MIHKALDAIVKSDIDGLIQDGVREGRSVEYKELLPGSTDDDKREFLADASSFANASGGDLLFGVKALGGVPTQAEGIPGDADAEILRLDNLLRTSLAPRLLGSHARAIGGFPKGPVVVLRVSRSWSAPHMVTFKGQSRFFTRNSAGKHQMDVNELRAAFALSESLPERIRRFRDERLLRICSAEAPVPLDAEVILVLHVLPLSSFAASESLDLARVRTERNCWWPIATRGCNTRFNIDGFVAFNGDERPTSVSSSYCQVFRTGQIEAVWTAFTGFEQDRRVISSIAYEKDTIEATQRYLAALKAFNVPFPVALVMTMGGMKGCGMWIGHMPFPEENSVIDRDRLFLPEVLIEDYPCDVPRAMRPIFDAVWNACGYERSCNYDNNGVWRPRQ